MTSRRSFIHHTALASAAFGAVPLLGQKSEKKFRTAIIGPGWWGMNILTEAMASKRIKVVAMCDVDARVLENVIEDVKSASGDTPRTFAGAGETRGRVANRSLSTTFSSSMRA